MTRSAGGWDDVGILAALVSLAEDHPEYDLRQLRALASARQYRGLYLWTRRSVEPGADVLDWGCGNGHFSFFLQKAGYRVTGYSFYAPPMRSLLEADGFRFVSANSGEPTALPFADGSFAAVASVGVLEHVREHAGNEEASLREIARVLRPGGVFLCYHFPNRGSWIDWVARRVGSLHRHDHRYTRSDIERLTRTASLELLDVERYGMLPRNVWGFAPRPVRCSRRLADLWDGLDAVLGVIFAPIAQNYRFVARKRSG